MEVCASDVDKIPRGNLRVPREEFAAVWVAAEGHQGEHPQDWYGIGVVMTCRWLACATVRPFSADWYVAPAPVTRRHGLALPERIEAEAIAAEVLLFRRPVPSWVAAKPGWVEGIVATLQWAWSRTGPDPWSRRAVMTAHLR